MKLSVSDEMIGGDFPESLSRLSPNAKPALSEMCRLEKELTTDFDEAQKDKVRARVDLAAAKFQNGTGGPVQNGRAIRPFALLRGVRHERGRGRRLKGKKGLPPEESPILF